MSLNPISDSVVLADRSWSELSNQLWMSELYFLKLFDIMHEFLELNVLFCKPVVAVTKSAKPCECDACLVSYFM